MYPVAACRPKMAHDWSPSKLLASDPNAKWWDGTRADLMTFNSGKVASWTDRISGIAASQGTASAQPAYSAGEGCVVASAADVDLAIPNIANSNNHKWLCMVVKFGFSAAPSGDGSLLYINGTNTTAGARQPFVGYTRATSKFGIQWLTAGPTFNQVELVADANAHVIVSRLSGGVHYAAIDGGAETSAGSGISLSSPIASTGLIGDFRAGNCTWKIKDIILGNNTISSLDAIKLARWGLNRLRSIT